MLRGELFSTDMVRAYLENRKSHTCRPVKPQPPEVSTVLQKDGKFAWSFWPDGPMDHLIKPKHRPGDYIYCRETFWRGNIFDQNEDIKEWGVTLYAADKERPDIDYESIKWRPSIHMPREAARLFFRISRVEVMRPEDVTEEFAREDGFEAGPFGGGWYMALGHFKRFWRDTYGPDARWMWVYWTEPVTREEAYGQTI